MVKSSNIRYISLELHRQRRGKITTASTFKIKNKKEYRYAMSPGVASVARRINQLGRNGAYYYTTKSHAVAFITDGSAVLGLGNLGPYSGLTIVEGKAALLKEFTGIDGIPIALGDQNTNKIIETIKNIAPTFGAINLEDIAAPKCFEIEEKLQGIGIPVFHDDQHGAAIAVYAALTNAAKVVEKKFSDLKVVICGSGAAGQAIARMLLGVDQKGDDLGYPYPKVTNVILLDQKGIIRKGRADLNKYKLNLSKITNKSGLSGSISDALVGADVLIGVSVGKILKRSQLKTMNSRGIVFAMANPIPEISMKEALAAGVEIYGSGRGDSKIHINNMVAFPGIFKGLLDSKANRFKPKMKYAVAIAIAKMVENPSRNRLLPNPFKENVSRIVANAIVKCKN